MNWMHTQLSETKTMTMAEVNEARRRLKIDNGIPSSLDVSRVAGTSVHTRIQMYLAMRKVKTALIGEISPATFPQVNGKLTGNSDTKDLPVCRVDGMICTCWQVSFWKRIQILVTGRIWMVAKGNTQPPMCLETEIVWK